MEISGEMTDWTDTGVATVVDAAGRVFGSVSHSQLTMRDRFNGVSWESPGNGKKVVWQRPTNLSPAQGRITETPA